MWSDIILHGERLYVLRLLLWAAISTIAGTGLSILSVAYSRGSAMIRRFAFVCAVLGTMELMLGAVEYQGLALRDLGGATRLERLAWFQAGLYLGMAAAGITMSGVARTVASRTGSAPEIALPSIGAGIAVALHGLALGTLELLLLAAIAR